MKIKKTPEGYEAIGEIDADTVDGKHASEIDADMVDGKHASELKHGISGDENTAIKVVSGRFISQPMGIYSVTGVGFKPRYVEFICTFTADTPGYARLGTGWMDWYGVSRVMAIASAGSTHYSRNNNAYCIWIINEVGATQMCASMVSMDNDGFTVNFGTDTGAYTIFWKAVR